MDSDLPGLGCGLRPRIQDLRYVRPREDPEAVLGGRDKGSLHTAVPGFPQFRRGDALRVAARPEPAPLRAVEPRAPGAVCSASCSRKKVGNRRSMPPSSPGPQDPRLSRAAG